MQMCKSLNLLFTTTFGSLIQYCGLHKLLIPGFGQFINVFLTNPPKLRLTGREASVSCHPQVSPQMFYQFWLSDSRTVRELVPKPLQHCLACFLHCCTARWTIAPVSGGVHARTSFISITVNPHGIKRETLTRAGCGVKNCLWQRRLSHCLNALSLLCLLPETPKRCGRSSY